jgi:S-(hydroxymethyl)mycothiol dehydrogenase
MPRITAAVCTAFGAPLVLQELELSAPTGRMIEVTLDAVAICHSDISYADGIWGGDLPAVYGHEAAGRITGIGDAVTGWSEGERVIVTLIRACGTCGPCTSGRPTGCATPGGPAPLSRPDGLPVVQAMNCGAFATRVVVDQSQIARMPADMPADAACLLSCGVITGIGAVVNAGQLRPGEDAVVIGAGGVGLNAIQGARLAGARRVVAVDMVQSKLADARAFGATDVIDASAAAPWEELLTLTGRPADAVFVTTGALPAFDSAPHYIGPGGRIVLVGMPASGAFARYEPANVAAWGQRLIGSKMGEVVLARDIPWLTDLWAQGRLKLEELVSGRWRLDQINEAIADTRAGAARRNVIVFD